MDRFALRLWSDYPDKEVEGHILSKADALENPTVEAVATPLDVMELRGRAKAVTVSDFAKSYLLDLVQGLRRDPDVAAGPSTRGSLALYRTSRAAAFLDGRDYVIPDDVQQLAIPVLEHRLRLSAEAELEGVTARQVLERVVESTPVPKGTA
jgi:MoxR-like ATPase